jgi:DNA-3-methyladenine glycosylase II
MPKALTSAVLDDARLALAVRSLTRRDKRFRPIVKHHGLPGLRPTTACLETLLQMVTEQFLSLAAAAAIFARIKNRLPLCSADQVLACPQDELVALGLSRAKARSFHGLALASLDGRLDFGTLRHLPDDEAHAALVALPGIGPWTADIFLLSALQRADVWPWGDVALQAAAQNLFDLQERPDRKTMQALGEAFRPHRTTAALLLWSHYRGLKGMTQTREPDVRTSQGLPPSHD